MHQLSVKTLKVKEEKSALMSFLPLPSPPHLKQEVPSGFRSHFTHFCPGFCLSLGWLSVSHEFIRTSLQK